jgi:hypothetical protein
MSAANKTSTPFTTNNPHAPAFLLYLNGIEVPCKSVTQREGVWQIPEMQLEMLADPVLTRFGAEDRVQAVVFYLDDVRPHPSVAPAFRLFGEGETTGWSYQNTPSGRSIVLTCVNQFAIFTQLFVQFLTTLDDMIAHDTFAGSGTLDIASPTSQIVYPFSLFQQGLILPQGENAPDITRPFEFMFNALRGMVGANVPAEQRTVPAANFFSRWARLTNFINRFVATPSFDEGGDKNVFPILKALQTTSAIDVLTKNLIGQIQNVGSIWDMLSLVYQTVCMEVAMLPRMPLVSVDLKTSQIQPTKPVTPPNPLSPNRLPNYFAKPQFLFGLPPACNVLFPSQIKMLSYDENYATQPTRLYFNDEVIPSVLKIGTNGHGQAIQNALTLAYPPEADALNAIRRINPKANGKNFLVFPEELFKGPVMDRRKIPPWLYFLKQAELTERDQDAPDASANPDGAPADAQALFDQLKNDNPDVQHLYAQYEFFRERYSRRQGAAVVGFNPYIVPGFPTAIFDNRATRVDLFAYVTSVTHKLTHSREGRTTQISFTYGRTVQEMFDLLAAEFAGGGAAAGAAPAEPIRDIRQVIQDFDQAETFYQGLFFGKLRPFNKDAALDWRQLIGYRPAVAGQPPERVFIEGPGEASLAAVADAGQTLVTLTPKREALKLDFARTQAAKQAAEATLRRTSSPSVLDELAIALANQTISAATTRLQQLQTEIGDVEAQLADAQATVNQHQQQLKTSAVIHNLDGARELVPLPSAEPYFANYDDAIRYNWRPICTLDEYLQFTGSVGEGAIPAFGHPRSVGARYYERIRRLTPLTPDVQFPPGADGLAPQTVPNPSAADQSSPDPTGDTTTPSSTTSVVPGLTSGTGPNGTNSAADFPQTRAPWDEILLAYRRNAFDVLAPRA